MSLPTIIVYSQSSNRNMLRLLDKNQPVLLDSVTKIELRLDSGDTLSSESYPLSISWATGDDTRGLIYLRLGELFFTTRTYTSELMVFDPINPLGVFWGFFRIRAIEERSNG